MSRLPPFEQNSGLPLLNARRAHCYHPRIPHFEPPPPFNFALRGYSREGHRGKLWDPRRFHRFTTRHWHDLFLEYLLFLNSYELDHYYVWYAAPAVSFRVNHYTFFPALIVLHFNNLIYSFF